MRLALDGREEAARLEFREFARTVVAPLAPEHDARERVERRTI
jgi:hypothetical protein